MAPTKIVVLCFGSLLTGCCMDVLLQGILFVQFTTYFQHYHDDRRFLKLTVLGLIIFTTAKSCQSFAMLWVQFMTAFGDLDRAFTVYAEDWTLRINSIMVAALGSYVRGYFCYRLYVISEAWWAVALVASTEVLGLSFLTAAFLEAFLRPDYAARAKWILLYFTLQFALSFAGDLLLSLLTAFFLTRHKREALPRSKGTINVLIRLTLEAAAPGAVCSFVNLVISQVPGPTFYLLACSNEILPKLYAVSMMWSLNARKELRSLSWGARSSLSYITSGNRSRSMATNQVEPNPGETFELRELSSGRETHVDNSEAKGIRSGLKHPNYRSIK